MRTKLFYLAVAPAPCGPVEVTAIAAADFDEAYSLFELALDCIAIASDCEAEPYSMFCLTDFADWCMGFGPEYADGLDSPDALLEALRQHVETLRL